MNNGKTDNSPFPSGKGGTPCFALRGGMGEFPFPYFATYGRIYAVAIYGDPTITKCAT